MTPKFPLTFLEIAKLAFLFQTIGLVIFVLIAYIIAVIFPDVVKRHLDMSPMNLPESVFFWGGLGSLVMYPFAVLGSWVIIKLFQVARGRIL